VAFFPPCLAVLRLTTSMKTIAICNCIGGTRKTTLVYHLTYMFSRLGYPTIAMDLDPQASLTSTFLDEDRLEELWSTNKETILGCVEPILQGSGDIRSPSTIEIANRLWLLAGDLGLSRFEDTLSESWIKGFNGDPSALRTTSSFYRIIQEAARNTGAALSLLDMGPNLGAINRAALLSADYLLVPLAADLFSLQGLKNLGPTIRNWRELWGRTRDLASQAIGFPLPQGKMQPAGYVLLQKAVRLDRPTNAYRRWPERIAAVYQESVLGRPLSTNTRAGDEDPNCVATLRNYSSLVAMAQEARKPMFDLRPADGAMGSHAQLVQTCYAEFKRLAEMIAEICALEKAA
jgi:chromosome partitioning protein